MEGIDAEQGTLSPRGEIRLWAGEVRKDSEWPIPVFLKIVFESFLQTHF
jgi:hypothetical protein